MPELPEVETVRRQIDATLPLKIERVEYSDVVTSILKEKNREFEVAGDNVIGTERIGKLLMFKMASGGTIMSHFGMSGGWRIGVAPVVEKHTHVQFACVNEKGAKLFLAYVDPRRFGNMLYLGPNSAKKYTSRLGVDIGSKAFTSEYILNVFAKYPERQLKPFLLDQKYFAGCGNYIACEICALAGIRPNKRVKRLGLDVAEKIRLAAKAVLEGQIKNQGLTFSGGYADAFGAKGGGVENLVVFHQEKCGMCKKTAVKKIVLAQRGTYYCPYCQK